MLYEVQTTEVKSMPIGPKPSATARRSGYWSAADSVGLCNPSILPRIAQICTALLVVIGLIVSTLAADTHVHAPAVDEAVTAVYLHLDAQPTLQQARTKTNPAHGPVACSACNHARVSVPLARQQQQSSESFRIITVSAPRLQNSRLSGRRQVASGTRASLKTTTHFSSLPPPARNL